MKKKPSISDGIMLGACFCPDVRLFFFIRERWIKPGDGVWGENGTRPRHLLFFIQNGYGSVRTHAGQFDLKAGDIICLFPQKELYWRADKKEPWNYLTLELIGSDVEKTLADLGFTRENPVLTPANPEKSVSTIEEYSAWLYAERKNPLMLQSILFRILAYMEDLHRLKEHVWAVDLVQAYIRLHYDQPITVAGLAEMCALSRSYLSRLFRQKTGRMIQEELISCRIHAAKRLLLESDYELEKIALLAGFRTVSAFYKSFRKNVGCSPYQYRSSRR